MPDPRLVLIPKPDLSAAQIRAVDERIAAPVRAVRNSQILEAKDGELLRGSRASKKQSAGQTMLHRELNAGRQALIRYFNLNLRTVRQICDLISDLRPELDQFDITHR